MASSMETGIDSLNDMVTGAVQCTAHSEGLELEAKTIKMDEGFLDTTACMLRSASAGPDPQAPASPDGTSASADCNHARISVCPAIK